MNVFFDVQGTLLAGDPNRANEGTAKGSGNKEPGRYSPGSWQYGSL